MSDNFRLPPSLRVGPFTYKIVLDDGLAAENCWGKADHDAKKIRIGAETARQPEQLTVTFLHELIHVVADMLYHTPLKEEQIKRLANGLADALQDLGIYPKGMELSE